MPLNPSATYTVCTTDYCAYNGGFYDAFKECPVIQSFPMLYRESLEPYIKEVYGGNVPTRYATPQGRIVFE